MQSEESKATTFDKFVTCEKQTNLCQYEICVWWLKYLPQEKNKQWILIPVKKYVINWFWENMQQTSKKQFFFCGRFSFMAVVAFAVCFWSYKPATSHPQANLHKNKKLATSKKSIRKTSNAQTFHKRKNTGVPQASHKTNQDELTSLLTLACVRPELSLADGLLDVGLSRFTPHSQTKWNLQQ